MTLRTRFILFITLIHILFIGLSLFLLYFNRYLFLAAEVVILFSVFITVRLYRDFMLPMKMVAAGIESIKDKDFSSKIVHDRKDELGRLLDVYNHMIDQLRSERVKQREQHFFLERLINASPSGIIILDFEDRIELINPAARTMLGDAEAEYLGRKTSDIMTLPGSELKDLNPGESKIVTINGIHLYRLRKSRFIDRGFSRYFILIEELTKEILKTEKRAYAKVIRMMSHEINNSVGAVNSILNSSLHYKEQLNEDDRRDFEEAIRVAVERNDRLNSFMSNFAGIVKIPAPQKERNDLNHLLNNWIILIKSEAESRNIECLAEFDSDEFIAEFDIQQMDQVIANVLKNGIEAVGWDGKIIIRSNSAGKFIEIIDNGKGLSEENRRNIFTPFYSTKRNGQGIGLTLTREILLNHGFGFDLQTLDGSTTFRIDIK